MRRQSNPITPHETWLELFWSKFNWTVYFLRAVFRFLFITCIQIKRFRGRFIFPHLSNLPRSDFPGSHWAKTHYRLALFWARTTKFFIFFCFLSWRMETLQGARNVWRLNSQISQDGTFVHYRFLYWTFFYLIYLLSLMAIFFPLFVCFDILWQLATTLFYLIYLLSLIGIFFRYLFVLTYCDSSRRHTHATTHATGTQIVRAKMTSLDVIFYRGNMSRSRSHARFCRRKHKKSTSRASRSWKEFELDL